MPVEVQMKDPPTPMAVVNCRPLVPVRVKEIRKLVCTDNESRLDEVQSTVNVGDVCVIFADRATYSTRIFHGPSGFLTPTWYADYLLFEDAADVRRVVIAKPEN